MWYTIYKDLAFDNIILQLPITCSWSTLYKIHLSRFHLFIDAKDSRHKQIFGSGRFLVAPMVILIAIHWLGMYIVHFHQMCGHRHNTLVTSAYDHFVVRPGHPARGALLPKRQVSIYGSLKISSNYDLPAWYNPIVNAFYAQRRDSQSTAPAKMHLAPSNIRERVFSREDITQHRLCHVRKNIGEGLTCIR